MAEYIEREAACSAMPDDYYGWRDKQLLKFVPAADVAPVRHGYWVYKSVRREDMPCCSECGESTGSLYEYAYCPNCGARMVASNG